MKNSLLLIAIVFVCLNTAIAVEPGDIGLFQQGKDALAAQDYPLAIELFQRALEATPDNKSIWYYSACAYSLSGDSLKAIEMLDNAFKTGYDNYRGLGRDPDFESIREMEQFKTIVAQMTEMENAKRAKTHYVKQTIYAPYELVYPQGYDPDGDTTYPLLVLLMFEDENINDFIDKLAMDDVIYLRANAPYHDYTDRIHYAYMPRGLPSRDHYKEVYEMDATWVAEMVMDAKTVAKVDTNCIVLTGFSQGGSITYATILDYPELVNFAAPLGGWIAAYYQDMEKYKKLAASDLKLFIGHSSDDPVINFSRADSAAKWLGDAGVELTRGIYTGGHDFSQEMATGLREWLQKSFTE